MRLRVGWMLVVLVGVLVAIGHRPLGAAIDGAALLTQVDRRLNPPAFDAYKRLINVEPDGRTREYLLYSINDGREKVVALFLEPASDKGRSTLRLGCGCTCRTLEGRSGSPVCNRWSAACSTTPTS